MTDKVEDKDKMLPEDNVYTLSDGSTLEVKPLSWGKEIKVCKLVAKFFDKTDLLTSFNSLSDLKEESALESIAEMILPLINEAPDAVTQIVSIITDKEEKFIEESLTSEDVMQVFIPFLKNLFSKYVKMFQVTK